jgi:hypothetical protein
MYPNHLEFQLTYRPKAFKISFPTPVADPGGWDGVDDYYGAESRVGDGSWEGDFEGFGSVG